MNPNVMSIQELKRTKNGWQVWEKVFSKRHNKLVNMERTVETQWEIMSLITVYSFCLSKTEQIVDIYSDMINRAELNDLSEKYFRSKIFEAKRLHRIIQDELDKPQSKKLAHKFFDENEQEKGLGV